MKAYTRAKGFCEPYSLIIVAACLLVGGYYAIKSKVIDSPAEQTAEALLRTEGIDVDFSAEKKKELYAPDLSQVPSHPN
jgi:hypothetical protein